MRVPGRLTAKKRGIETGSGQGQPSNLEEAFNSEDAGYLSDIRHDVFQMLAIGNFQRQVNAGMQIVRVAGESADVRTSVADYAGDIGEHSWPVLRANQQVDGIDRSGGASPFDIDLSFHLIQQILNVWTGFGMNSDAAAARDVSHDVISGDRIATFLSLIHI